MRQTLAVPPPSPCKGMRVQGGGVMLRTQSLSPRNIRNIPLLRPRHQKHPVLSRRDSDPSGACRQTAAQERCSVSASKATCSRDSEWNLLRGEGQKSSATFADCQRSEGGGCAIAQVSLTQHRWRSTLGVSQISQEYNLLYKCHWSRCGAPNTHRLVSAGEYFNRTSDEHFVKLPVDAASITNAIIQNTDG